MSASAATNAGQKRAGVQDITPGSPRLSATSGMSKSDNVILSTFSCPYHACTPLLRHTSSSKALQRLRREALSVADLIDNQCVYTLRVTEPLLPSTISISCPNITRSYRIKAASCDSPAAVRMGAEVVQVMSTTAPPASLWNNDCFVHFIVDTVLHMEVNCVLHKVGRL